MSFRFCEFWDKKSEDKVEIKQKCRFFFFFFFEESEESGQKAD